MTRKAIILSAGQGKRLLPLTEQRPKCLLSLGGRPLLEWQIDALAANHIREVVVVTGFHAQAVETVIRDRADGNFILLNGDALFHPALLFFSGKGGQRLRVERSWALCSQEP